MDDAGARVSALAHPCICITTSPTARASAKDTLDVWPALPLDIQDDITTKRVDNIISVLKLTDRVCRINLDGVTESKMEEICRASHETCSLTRIDISGVVQSIRPKYQQRHPSYRAQSRTHTPHATLRESSMRWTRNYHSSFLSVVVDATTNLMARTTSHVGHRHPQSQFETLAELAYCAVDEG